jgi:hypothetical protein
MADTPLSAYIYCMRYNKSFQDQYRPPEDDVEGFDRIQARFERLARKVRDESGTGQTKFIRPAEQRDAPVFGQSNQRQFPWWLY